MRVSGQDFKYRLGTYYHQGPSTSRRPGRHNLVVVPPEQTSSLFLVLAVVVYPLVEGLPRMVRSHRTYVRHGRQLIQSSCQFRGCPPGTEYAPFECHVLHRQCCSSWQTKAWRSLLGAMGSVKMERTLSRPVRNKQSTAMLGYATEAKHHASRV